MDANIFKTELGNYRRHNHHPNLIDGATVILFGGRKLVGAFLKDVRYIGDGCWTGQRMHAKNVYRWCSRELLSSEPRGSEVRFRAESVWLAFHPDFVLWRVDTPLECSALTTV